MLIFISFFDEIHVGKQNSPIWDAAFSPKDVKEFQRAIIAKLAPVSNLIILVQYSGNSMHTLATGGRYNFLVNMLDELRK